MTTTNDIISAAYKKIKIKSPSAVNNEDALVMLNNMVSMWGLALTIPCVTREVFDSIIDQRIYTIGTGGDFDTARPLTIINVLLRDSNNYDYPMKIIAAKEFNRISNKFLSGRPSSIYYIPEYPLGVIRFNKKFNVVYKIKFEFWKSLTEFPSLVTEINLPPEYKEAIVYNLAVRLAEDNSVELPMSILNIASTSLTLISRLHAINRPAAIARWDFNEGSSYNIVTGD